MTEEGVRRADGIVVTPPTAADRERFERKRKNEELRAEVKIKVFNSLLTLEDLGKAVWINRGKIVLGVGLVAWGVNELKKRQNRVQKRS